MMADADGARRGLAWDGRLTIGNVLTLAAMLLAGLIAFLELRADNIVLRGEIADMERRLVRIEGYVYQRQFRYPEPGLGYPSGARASASELSDGDF